MKCDTPLAEFRKRSGRTLDATAKLFKIDRTTMLRWEREVPLKRVLDVERITGISRHELRPDVFGPASEKAA